MSGNQYPGDVQFAGLIQAATAAADAREHDASILGSVLGKRRRSEDESLIDTQLRSNPSSDIPTTIQATGQLTNQATVHAPPPTPTLHSSASVLFREPSEKSKKYSRPPLGKVYLDLQLAPEVFLRLQNAAKTFMLDENHLGRRNVVGHAKNASNNDAAKLKLWGYVTDFMNADNNGERFFGHDAGVGLPNAPARTMFWPQDAQKIIKLCMPLFRKMVTNERQRLYASQTRRQDSKKTDKSKENNTSNSQDLDDSALLPLNDGDNVSAVEQSIVMSTTQETGTSATSQQPQDVANIDRINLHINVTTNNDGIHRRLVPKISVSSATVLTLSALITDVNNHVNLGAPFIPSADSEWFLPIVKAWLPDGLARIKNDEHWVMALLSASMVDWMDSELRVIIEI